MGWVTLSFAILLAAATAVFLAACGPHAGKVSPPEGCRGHGGMDRIAGYDADHRMTDAIACKDGTIVRLAP